MKEGTKINISAQLYYADSDSDNEVEFTIEEVNKKVNSLPKDLIKYSASTFLLNIAQSILENSHQRYVQQKLDITQKHKISLRELQFSDWKKYLPGLYIFNKSDDTKTKDKTFEAYYDRYSKQINTYLDTIVKYKQQYSEKKTESLKNIKEYLKNTDVDIEDIRLDQLIFENHDQLRDALIKQIKVTYFKPTDIKIVNEIIFGSEDESKTIDKKHLKLNLKNYDNYVKYTVIKKEIISDINKTNLLQNFYQNYEKIRTEDIEYIPLGTKRKKSPSEVDDEFINFNQETIKNYITAEGEYKKVYSIQLLLDTESDNIKHANEINTLLNKKLLSSRPNKAFFEDKVEHFSNFKLNNKINRSIIKTKAVDGVTDSFVYEKHLPLDNIASGSIKIFSSGSRTDYENLPLRNSNSSAYSNLIKEITNLSYLDRIPDILKNPSNIAILKGQSYLEQEFLLKFLNLLFNCETERNVSAFITNAMFFDLVSKNIYALSDLPTTLPMAIKKDDYNPQGAVPGIRYMLDLLGGTYGSKGKYLLKRQYYDFGPTNEDKAKELAARDTALLIDWLCLQKILDPNQLIKFGDKENQQESLKEITQSIREIPAPNRKEQKDIWYAKFNAISQEVLAIFNKDSIAQTIFKAFHNLVYDWYGIRLDWLYSFEEFTTDNKDKFLSSEDNKKLKELIKNLSNYTGLKSLRFLTKDKMSSALDIDDEQIIEICKNEENKDIEVIFPKEWPQSLREAALSLINALHIEQGHTISLQGLEENFKYLQDQFEKWVNELWNSKTGSLSQKAYYNDLSEDSRESQALKYWQSKYKKNNNDPSIKSLLAASAGHRDTLINILKDEAKIEGISTHVKNFIIQYLDKVSRIDISQLLANEFLNNTNSIELREQLLSKIAEHAGSVNNLKLQPDTQHQDATEFLEPLYSNAFGMYKIIINITCKNQDEVAQYHQKPQIEEEPTAIIQLEINKNNKFSQLLASLNKTEDMIDDNKVEFEKVDSNTKVKIDAVKTTKTIIPDNRREICFSIKRFGNDLAKINDLIEFDQIKVNEQDYEITAFIRHTGSLLVGHYTTYVKEKDGKWYCYNDATRREVDSGTLNEAKKSAYVVKYSTKDDLDLLPAQQLGIDNDTGARCWLNASVVFTKSFTTLQDALKQFIQENEGISQDSGLLKCINPQKPLNIQEDLSSGDIKMECEYKGISNTKEGLNLQSIKLNLATIIISNLNNIDFYIAPNLISEEELILKFNNWKMTTSSHYGALIGIEDQFGNKHAVLFYASKETSGLAIKIIDPLSKKDSTFKNELKKLAQSLHEPGVTVDIIYSGKQDQDYGTCADISLIMLQELIEQTTSKPHFKPIQDIDNNLITTSIISDCTHNNCTHNSVIHNFDYDNHQLDLLGHHDAV